MPPKILIVFGTRPEAIKLCPLVHELRSRAAEFTTSVCVTAQHRSMLDTVLNAFEVKPDHDLDVMRPNQSLAGLTSRVLKGLDEVLVEEKPAFVVVQGDTTTTFAGALAAFYRRIPVGHVEAGLRTGDMDHPFPEELNRVLTGRMTALHFAPTERSAGNLLAEGVAPERVHVTGNTAIDALLWVKGQLESGRFEGYKGPLPRNGRKLIVMTAHRRESFGGGFERICEAVRAIALRGDVEVVYPVHLNPNVRDVVRERLGDLDGVHLIEPLDYVPFVDLLRRADVVLTDSGGIQEEAPSLGLPVVVMREKTERQEAVDAGTALLVGTDPERIREAVFGLLDDAKMRERMRSSHNPFGNGDSSRRIADLIHSFLGTSDTH